MNQILPLRVTTQMLELTNISKKPPHLQRIYTSLQEKSMSMQALSGFVQALFPTGGRPRQK
jgi:hypothetical protein